MHRGVSGVRREPVQVELPMTAEATGGRWAEREQGRGLEETKQSESGRVASASRGKSNYRLAMLAIGSLPRQELISLPSI